MGLFRPMVTTRTRPRVETSDRDGGTITTPREWLISALGGSTTPAGIRVTESVVESLDAAYACIGVLSETTGQTPCKVMESLPNGAKRERPDTLEYQLLHQQPNPECHAPQFFQALTRQAVSRGQAFAEIQRNNFGEPIAMWPLLSSHMRVDRDERRYLRYTYTLPSGETRWWVREPGRPAPILHLAINSVDGVHGRSPVKLLADTMGWAKATEEYGARFFANNATPSTVVSYPGRLKPKTKEALRASWEEKFRGLQNSHRLAILEEGMKLEKLGIPPNEAQFLETMRFHVEKICRIYRVPPFMVGHTEKTTSWGSGIGDMQVGFVTFTMMWWFVNWIATLKRDLFGAVRAQTLQPLFVVNALMRGDVEKRFKAYYLGRQMGMYNANDLLRLEDMNPREDAGGDVYWEQAGVPAAMLESSERAA
ncbi:MAG: phage portal protein [Luteitalea sp.]